MFLLIFLYVVTLFSFCLPMEPEKESNREDVHKRLPLHSAIRAKSFEEVKRLVRSGASVNAHESSSEKSPLMLAAEINQPDIVDFLYKEGAELEAVGINRYHTPAWCAIVNRSQKALEKLLQSGANANAACDSSGRPLLTDAMSFLPESMDLLCRFGADVDAKDAFERAVVDHALDLFFMSGDSFAYDILKKNGATITEEQKERKRAIRELLQ